jgi:hypothetical protein
MSTWQERLDRGVRPDEAAGHRLRYAAAASIVATADVWVDLGCGDGRAALAALSAGTPPRIVLVDVSAETLDEAERAIRGAEAVQADLTAEADLATVRAHVAGAASPAITCFATIEHLATFAPLVELLDGLAGEGATVVLSVPNHVAAGDKGESGITWGEAAFGELRRLLPQDAIVARQFALAGSAVVVGDDALAAATAPVELDLDQPPTELIAAFGPRATELRAGALVAGVDRIAQRRLDRDREADLAYLEAEVARLREGRS